MFIIILTLICFSVILCIKLAAKAEVKHQEKELVKVKKEIQNLVNPDRMYDRLGVDIVSMQVGQGLLCITDPDKNGLLLAKLAALRQRLTDDLGYIIPNIRIADSTDLQNNEYCISIRNNITASGFVYPGRYMVNAEQWDSIKDKIPNDAVIGINPIYQNQAYWISEKDAKMTKNIITVAPEDVIVQHLQEVLIRQADVILSEKDVKKIIDLVKTDISISADKLLEKLSYSDIRQIFANLIQEKVSIRDITFVLSKLEDYSRFYEEPDILSEKLRKDLSRQISLNNCDKNRIIYALTLSPELSQNLGEKVELQTGFNKTEIKLDNGEEKEFAEKVTIKLLKAHKQIGIYPVLLCDDKIRLPLYRLLVKQKNIPTIVVIATSEMTDIRLEIIDTI